MPERQIAQVPIEETTIATGEIHPNEVPQYGTPAMEGWLADSRNAPLGTVDITAEETERLCAPFEDHEWDILPTGEVYVSHMRYRQRLTSVFGPGGWMMRPVSAIAQAEAGNAAHQRWEMWVRGSWFATSVGSSRYGGGDNERFDYADMAEAIKSNALTRMCKDIPIGADLYDRARINQWRSQFAIQVTVQRPNDRSARQQWRRADRDPFPYEQGSAYRPTQTAAPQAAHAPAPTAAPRAQAPAPAPAPRAQAPTRQAAPQAARRASAPAGAGDVLESRGTVSDIRMVRSGDNARGHWELMVVRADVDTPEGVRSAEYRLFSTGNEQLLEELATARDTEARLIFRVTAEVNGRFTNYTLVGIEFDGEA